ncbi:hypothetical protein Cgig2_004815 [Carnegiea gigantea]|uniref:Uncharacterized protein n=1 Tax=Carnegiea gigantea TaxID=171969 RepID=A0A9Q1QPG0_9CARY|nr:hypothetical protein Cgig2_004815 [Carnegiea gigantea]
MLITALSPNSPLSLNSSSNGNVDHQDNVPSPPNPTQPGITTVLDGSGCNLTGQSDPTCPDSYSDILKFGVGGHGSAKMCPLLNQNSVINFDKVTLQGSFPSFNTPRQPNTSTLNPMASNVILTSVQEQEQSFQDQTIPQPVHTPNPGSVIPDGIILANLTAILPTDDPSLVPDPLDAINEDMLDDMEAKNNADLYLNLHNLEDIEMSSDSTKKKRSEDGEEATSQAT